MTTSAPSAAPILMNDEPLGPRTTLRVGGSAAHFATVKTPDEARDTLRLAADRGWPVHLLAGGSNLVVSDAGVPGLVLDLAMGGVATVDPRSDDRVHVRAGAGEPWDAFVGRCVADGLAGLECLSGIPGRVGATPIQNVGAYGQEVSDTIVEVEAIDRRSGAQVTLPAAECAFGYRDSRFKSREPDRFLVTAVTFALRPGGPPTVRYGELKKAVDARPEAPRLGDVRALVLELRARKSMVLASDDPNGRSCGSFFVNPVVDSATADRIEAAVGEGPMPRYPEDNDRVKLAAAWLIERAGLTRGMMDGPVGLSTKHTLAIVAHDGARARDVVRFARRVQATVADRFGVRLHAEPRFWGFGALDDGGLPVAG